MEYDYSSLFINRHNKSKYKIYKKAIDKLDKWYTKAGISYKNKNYSEELIYLVQFIKCSTESVHFIKNPDVKNYFNFFQLIFKKFYEQLKDTEKIIQKRTFSSWDNIYHLGTDLYCLKAEENNEWFIKQATKFIQQILWTYSFVKKDGFLRFNKFRPNKKIFLKIYDNKKIFLDLINAKNQITKNEFDIKFIESYLCLNFEKKVNYLDYVISLSSEKNYLEAMSFLVLTKVLLFKDNNYKKEALKQYWLESMQNCISWYETGVINYKSIFNTDIKLLSKNK